MVYHPKTSLKAICILVCASFFGGCSTAPVQPLMTESDPAVQALNESAMRVARAAEQSALSHSVNNKRSRVTEEYKIDLSVLPKELRDPLLLEDGFNGELEVFISSLADVIGWPTPIILGNKPGTPLMVSMTEQRRPPAHWIADAGYQAGRLATVSINPSLRQITVRYAEGGGVR